MATHPRIARSTHRRAAVHLALVDDDIRKMSWAVPVTVVEALAVTGRASIALEIALTIDDPADRTEALRSIISAVADTYTAQALMIARLIGDDHERSSALSDIALTVAGTDTEGALGIANTIDEPVEQHRTLAEIAVTVAETSVQDGLEIARSIGEPDFTISALLEIAAATDRPDVLDEATALVRSRIRGGARSPCWRSRTLHICPASLTRSSNSHVRSTIPPIGSVSFCMSTNCSNDPNSPMRWLRSPLVSTIP